MADETYRRVDSGRYGLDTKLAVPSPTDASVATKNPGADKPVDKMAGKGSLADKLRLRRKAMDGGDASGGQSE